jgi:hypothetical protein
VINVQASATVHGDELTVYVAQVFDESFEPVTGMGRELLALRTQLVDEATRLGFSTLVIEGFRTEGSSSARPDEARRLVVDLTRRR